MGIACVKQKKSPENKTISFAKLSMDGISTWSCKKYKQSYRDFLFFHCNKNLFSRCRNYKTFQCIWCNWPNVGRKLFTDKYLAWYTLCQSNGCMKSLQVLKGWVERMGYWSQSILLPFLFLFFLMLYPSKFHSCKPRTRRKVYILCNWCLAAYNSATQE